MFKNAILAFARFVTKAKNASKRATVVIASKQGAKPRQRSLRSFSRFPNWLKR